MALPPWGVAVILAVCGLFLVPTAAAGEADQAQPYEKVSYPSFENGRLHTLLEANKATAYDLTEATPRVNLEDVVITLYDHAPGNLLLPDDQPPPVKMTITSDRGYLTRRPPEPNTKPEDVAHLEGNVVIRHYRTIDKPSANPSRPSRLPPGVETEIRCDNAQWNRTVRKLHSDGKVEFLNEDSRIDGIGFLYIPDDVEETEGDGKNLKNMGGIAFIENNARMEIDSGGTLRLAGDGKTAGNTVITCKDTASYRLREREIQFETDVKVASPDVVIEADILKVLLRQEEELQEDAKADPDSPLPGQVKNIIATIGKRGGSVVIKGIKKDPANQDDNQYLAKGSRADFEYDQNRITLIDVREKRYPSVEFGFEKNFISDENLVFTFTREEQPARSSSLRPGAGGQQEGAGLDTMLSFGGNGTVHLYNRPNENAALEKTTVTYTGDLVYNRGDGRIRFREKVDLRRTDIAMRAEILDVRLVSDGISPEPSRVSRILAEEDVHIQAGGRTATAHRAEYDIYVEEGGEGKNVDTLRLYGPAQGVGPARPSIQDENENKITAPEIHMQRLKTSVLQKDLHLLMAGGGDIECNFFTNPEEEGGRRKTITINCQKGMEYNEAEEKAHFEGGVYASSSSPEDNYTLTSDRLIINFKEIGDANADNRTRLAIRRITASGNARLTQDARECTADQIMRDFPTLKEKEGEIYLLGVPGAAGQAPILARYIEKDGNAIGSMVDATVIQSSADGGVIKANGPGSLSVPDHSSGIDGTRSEITFQQYASYESFPDSLASRATFRKGVVLRQPSQRLSIATEELVATFLRDFKEDERQSGEENRNQDQIDVKAIGRLRRAEFKNGVKVDIRDDKGVGRQAVGDTGSIDLEPTGDIIKIAADQKPGSQSRARLQDDRGMVLLSPSVEMREGQGFIRADGPGELHLPADPSSDSVSKVPTVVVYGDRGAMVYNELALNIRVTDRVRILQPGLGNNWRMPSLDGTCEVLEITLFEPPEAEMSGDIALSKVRKMDAQRNVVVRIYADAPPENPNIDWLSRPGTTIFTRGDRGEFFVPENRIEISCLPGRQPQVILNVVDPPSPTHRQRMKADRIILTTTPRRWSLHGQQESATIREGEPFDFVD